MHIFATFDQSYFLELAFTELEQKGIDKRQIFAIAMERRKSKRKLLDNIHYSDGISIFDGATVLGSLLMVFGSIYGFVLEWGPIVWGLIGFLVGGILGGTIDYFVRQWWKKSKEKNPKGKAPEVIVIVKCSKEQANWVEEVLLDHFAMGVSKFDKETESKHSFSLS